jgi:hypothetical protein
MGEFNEMVEEGLLCMTCGVALLTEEEANEEEILLGPRQCDFCERSDPDYEEYDPDEEVEYDEEYDPDEEVEYEDTHDYEEEISQVKKNLINNKYGGV